MQDFYPTRGNAEKIIDRADPVIHGTATGNHALKEDEAAYYEANGFIVFPDFFQGKKLPGSTVHWRRSKATSH